jgi:hypothetical protein
MVSGASRKQTLLQYELKASFESPQLHQNWKLEFGKWKMEDFERYESRFFL